MKQSQSGEGRLKFHVKRMMLTDLLDAMLYWSDTEEWYDRRPEIEIYLDENGYFAADIELDDIIGVDDSDYE